MCIVKRTANTRAKLYKTLKESEEKTKSEAKWCPQIRQEITLPQFLFPRRRQESEVLDVNEIPATVYYCFVQMFYGGPAVRRKLTAYEIHAAIGPLKCCKVFDIFGSVRVPSRLKSSSSHHWPSSAPGDEFVIEALNFERAVLAPS
ncbi:hypothetical protein K0M31_007629 [Melipona bicolor]|uniref:Uncharacterized protein n=1 Tax=Melipona bicolor TaxID=60889 RepID=A0AA40GC27_9HYME|nr:hypothetical protein K0M31_007629 [Melipona bicolor]